MVMKNNKDAVTTLSTLVKQVLDTVFGLVKISKQVHQGLVQSYIIFLKKSLLEGDSVRVIFVSYS
jgi:hypothetical protein